MSYRYKCIKTINGKQCDTRISLKRRVELYKIKPKCPRCNNQIHYRDRARERESTADKCGCDGYHFPHRKGSRYCVENIKNLTDVDHEERYNSTS